MSGRDFIVELVNEVWGADWAVLWPILEALSGLPQAEFLARVEIPARTARRWRRGECVPRSSRFAEMVPRLQEVTGLRQDVLVEARERSLVKREGGLAPRPSWARQYAVWGLELSHYLSRLAQERHLNYQDAAALVGYHVERWTQWVKGETVPRMWETKKVWRIIAAPQGVLWAEFLAARNRGARVVQARRWRLVKAEREVALAQEEGEAALDALWESVADMLNSHESRDQGDEQRLVEVLARFSARQWKALKKEQAELRELYKEGIWDMARRRHDRSQKRSSGSVWLPPRLPPGERSYWQHYKDDDGKIRSVRPEAADSAVERLRAGWDIGQITESLMERYRVSYNLASKLFHECEGRLREEQLAAKSSEK